MQQLLSKAIMALVLLVAVVAACTQPDPAAAKKSAAAPTAAVAAPLPPDGIQAAVAQREKAKWDSIRNVIITQLGGPNSPNAKYIMRGFNIPIDDLKGILAAYHNNPQPNTDAIYGMLSVKSTGEAGLILQTKNSQTDQPVYFDFSKLCPPDPNCPNY